MECGDASSLAGAVKFARLGWDIKDEGGRFWLRRCHSEDPSRCLWLSSECLWPVRRNENLPRARLEEGDVVGLSCGRPAAVSGRSGVSV